MDMSQTVYSLLIIVGFIFTISEPVEALKQLTPEKLEEWRTTTLLLFDALDEDKNGAIEVADLLKRPRNDAPGKGSKPIGDAAYKESLTKTGKHFIKEFGDANGDGKLTFDEFLRENLKSNDYEA